MKRRVFCLVIAAVFTMLLTGGAWAYDMTEYTMDEFDLVFCLPEEFSATGVGVSGGDDNDFEGFDYDSFGVDRAGMEELLESIGECFYAEYENIAVDMAVTLQSIADFGNMSDETLEELMDMSGMETDGTKGSVYRVGDYAYICWEEESSVAFTTNHNGYHVIVMVSSQGGTLGDKAEEYAYAIVDSIEISEKLPESMEIADSGEPLEVTDPERGISYTVPAGWIKAPNQNVSDGVAYIRGNDASTVFLLVYMDAWGSLSPQEQAITDREDFDNDNLSRKDILDAMGMYGSDDLDDLEVKNYGGIDYFVLDGSEMSGVAELGMTQIVAIRFVNGYMYQFQFMASDTELYMDDFTAWIGSAVYDADQKPETGKKTGDTSAGKDGQKGEEIAKILEPQEVKTDRSDAEAILYAGFKGGIAALVVGGLTLAVKAIFGKKKSKDEEPREGETQPPVYTQPGEQDPAPTVSETQPVPEEPVFVCPVCGSPLHTGDAACPGCGVPLSW